MSNPLRKFGKRKVTVPSAPPPPRTMQGRLLFKRGGGYILQQGKLQATWK